MCVAVYVRMDWIDDSPESAKMEGLIHVANLDPTSFQKSFFVSRSSLQ